MFVITIAFGPYVPKAGDFPLVLKEVLVAPDVSAAVKAFAEQDGVEWVEVDSAVPIDPAAPFTVIDY